MSGFTVTYEIITQHSAQFGDAEERGFVAPGGWHVNEREEMTLRAALQLCQPQEDCGRWWSETDGDTDYRTGAVETRSIHPPRNITPAAYRRITRLLMAR